MNENESATANCKFEVTYCIAKTNWALMLEKLQEWKLERHIREIVLAVNLLIKKFLSVLYDGFWACYVMAPRTVLKLRMKQFVGNKAKGRISKRVFQKNKAGQIFQKTNVSYPLIHTRTFTWAQFQHFPLIYI